MAKQVSPRGPVELLTTDREKVTADWIDTVAGSLQGRISRAEVDRELRELYGALVEGLREGGDDTRGESLSEARALLTELSRNRARQGFTPSETAISVLALKQALEPALRNDSADDTTAYLRLARVLDDLALFTVEAYTRTREEIISSQAAQLMELSTPVVKLWNGVIAVPLVGTLDSARTQVVMEKLLQALVDTGSEQAIIDITGVPAVDTQVAQHLLKTVVAARLMGAECTVSGIRPQIAQTIVALGIEFGDIITKATLADALQHALRASGVDLVAHQGVGR
ncbi:MULTISPECIES: STAS domain-containing protein [Streptomyces]|uniref:Anti-anti-sigma regulatory factor n=1 Tax=Streptomyces griseus subsp. griseus (strain JCM 4626 / CBS 651.72 / NBRC 13350 / KCC S-0626 / ISP 5235) TaxID=455632 RepID=B1W2N5_STRGG|nr:MULTISPECIES: STAS domain-containing protein [Streptomyces]MYR11905.1 STAS domain-containing protein [Streptomyces sp. SID724]MYT76729.1 STAS domain-containing protein [Streptomyces sp. SID8364]NEB56880.1 STAS domain-containing protein [Streptomyces griseus]SBU87822.1 rsbT co-antagonist protein RsbR [Streptomyces sp. MnatMP-M77]SCD85164.1 rsbT co-antagonist protein RsbR [Streptomyces sp. OspMP-M43]